MVIKATSFKSCYSKIYPVFATTFLLSLPETTLAKQKNADFSSDYSLADEARGQGGDVASHQHGRANQFNPSPHSQDAEKAIKDHAGKNSHDTGGYSNVSAHAKGNNTFQGQATSSAFSNEYAVVPIDITFGADKPLTPASDAGAPQGKNLPSARHATPSGQTVKAVTKEALNKAIAADALKRKLKEEQRKKLLLEEFAKQKKHTEKNMVLDLISTTHSPKK